MCPRMPFFSHWPHCLTDSYRDSELQDPRPVIASLFGTSTTSSLPSRILALYIHNGVKIYAQYLNALSLSWDESSLDQVRSISTALEDQLAACAANDDVELQERAAELKGLLALVRKGLDGPRPVRARSGGFAGGDDNDDGEGGGFAGGAEAPLPPNSLALLEPLFFAHELNPVNPKAQAMVALPEGLDLDAVIAPQATRAGQRSLSDDEREVDPFGRRIGRPVPVEMVEGGERRKKKGKGVAGKKSERRRPAEDDPEELARVSRPQRPQSPT